MPTIPAPFIPLSTFAQFTSGDINVPGASENYQTFLASGFTVAPQGVLQIGPFAFDYEGDDNVSQASEITDHFVEDNTAVQDHIGIKPVRITLKGIVSELTFGRTLANTLLLALTSVENGLSQTDAYLGKYTAGVTDTLLTTISQVENVAVQIEQGAARVAQIASYFIAGPYKSKQQQAYATLSSLQLARVLFTVYTPFQVFSNMAIEDFDMTQPGFTKTQANITVRMKQLQFSNTVTPSSFTTQFGGRASTGFQPTVTTGLTSGFTSAISNITSAF